MQVVTDPRLPYLQGAVMVRAWRTFDDGGFRVGAGGGYVPKNTDIAIGSNATTTKPMGFAFVSAEEFHPRLFGWDNVGGSGLDVTVGSHARAQALFGSSGNRQANGRSHRYVDGVVDPEMAPHGQRVSGLVPVGYKPIRHPSKRHLWLWRRQWPDRIPVHDRRYGCPTRQSVRLRCRHHPPQGVAGRDGPRLRPCDHLFERLRPHASGASGSLPHTSPSVPPKARIKPAMTLSPASPSAKSRSAPSSSSTRTGAPTSRKPEPACSSVSQPFDRLF
jgi:hypothetical protein